MWGVSFYVNDVNFKIIFFFYWSNLFMFMIIGFGKKVKYLRSKIWDVVNGKIILFLFSFFLGINGRKGGILYVVKKDRELFRSVLVNIIM